MSELAPLIKDLAIILSVASIVTVLFQKIRQPVVLGYLIAGMIIGPYTPPYALVKITPNIQSISELGVIFLMFSLGLDFSFHKLKRVGFSASVTGVVEVLVMLIIGLVTGLAIGWSFNDSLFLGAALAISSTTIIIKALEELQLKNKRFAELVFGILVVEDLVAILLLVGLSMIVVTHQFLSLALGWAAIKLILVVGGWFLVGYFLVPTFLHRIVHYVSEETLTLISVALCLSLVCLAAYLHYSSALGAFIMGSILAETTLVHRIEQLIRPLRYIFASVFFVSVGMLIDPRIIWHNFTLVLLLTAVTIIGKLFTTGIGAFLTGQSLNTALRVGFSMAQIGEFSFIIIALGLSLNAINASLYPIVVAVSTLTTFTTPYLIKLSGYLTQQADKRFSERMKHFLGSYAAWIYRTRSHSNSQFAYRKMLLRLFINAIIIAIIFSLAEHVLLPKISKTLTSLSLSKALSWVSALILSSPFIWGMLTSVRFYFSVLIIAAEIIVLSAAYFHTWLITILLVLVAIIFFTLLYKQLEKAYYWFENHLVNNLQAKSSGQAARYEELAPWESHLVEIVCSNPDFAGKTLQTLQLRETYGLNIVAIHRGKAILFAPSGQDSLQLGDKLIVLGNDDQIDAICKQLEKNGDPELEQQDILANFILKALFLEDKHPAVGQAIRDSKIREQIHGLVVGLERNGRRLLNPPSTTVLQAGDLLLVVGESSRLQDF